LDSSAKQPKCRSTAFGIGRATAFIAIYAENEQRAIEEITIFHGISWSNYLFARLEIGRRAARTNKYVHLSTIKLALCLGVL
jgi:hypothetical protein